MSDSKMTACDHLFISLWMHENPSPIPEEGVTVAKATSGKTPRWDQSGRVLLKQVEIDELRESLVGFAPTWNLPADDARECDASST